MRTVRIQGADPRPLAAPDDWSEEKYGHCGALFVRREEIDGMNYMRSAWEVDPAEAALLYAGGSLILGVAGNCHPVVHMEVVAPAPEFDPVVHARRYTAPDGTDCCRVEILFPHEGGRRAFAVVKVTGRLADAVAEGIELIEALARSEGWTA